MSFYNPFRSALTALRYSPIPALATTVRGFSLLTQTPTSASGARVTRALNRPAYSGAVRECPTPVILIRAPGMAGVYNDKELDVVEEKEDWSTWAGMFSERGYTTLEVDVTAPEINHNHAATPSTDLTTRNREQSSAVLKEMSKLLSSQIRLLAIPFAPIIISEGRSSWLAQAYIEDNPASALVMIDPAPSADDDSTGNLDLQYAPRFGYEPHFPVLLLASEAHMERVKASRTGRTSVRGTGRGGKGVTIEAAPEGGRSEARRIVVERWMDTCGF